MTEPLPFVQSTRTNACITTVQVAPGDGWSARMEDAVLRESGMVHVHVTTSQTERRPAIVVLCVDHTLYLNCHVGTDAHVTL